MLLKKLSLLKIAMIVNYTGEGSFLINKQKQS